MVCVMLGPDSIRDGWTFMANTCFSVSAGLEWENTRNDVKTAVLKKHLEG